MNFGFIYQNNYLELYLFIYKLKSLKEEEEEDTWRMNGCDVVEFPKIEIPLTSSNFGFDALCLIW